MKKILSFIIIFSVMIIGTQVLASLYQCTSDKKGMYFFDTGNNPQNYCTKKLCYVYDSETKKEEQICNHYSEYHNLNYAQKCITDYRKIYNEKFNDYKTGKCLPYRVAIVKSGQNECVIDFIVKNGKAIPQRGFVKSGDMKILSKCEQILKNTYPKASPYIKLRNPLSKQYRDQYILE